MKNPSTEKSKKIARLERRVVNAAMKLADAGGGFMFKSDRTIHDVGCGIALEKACGALKEIIK